jgi:hypothetical protein
MHLIKKIFFLSIIIVLFSCNKDKMFERKAARTPAPLYDFPNNKLWAHRINTVEEANEAFAKFDGVETDVYYLNDKMEFFTGHGVASALSLDSLFAGITDVSEHYYWIDMKNLNKANLVNSVIEMRRIVTKYKLKDKLIIESIEPELLAFFKEVGMYTSRSVRSTYNKTDELLLKTQLQHELRRYKFDALSADYSMYPFLKKYFNYYNLHIWTNNLSGESGKETIREAAANPAVKVILVDYSDNFLIPGI